MRLLRFSLKITLWESIRLCESVRLLELRLLRFSLKITLWESVRLCESVRLLELRLLRIYGLSINSLHIIIGLLIHALLRIIRCLLIILRVLES